MSLPPSFYSVRILLLYLTRSYHYFTSIKGYHEEDKMSGQGTMYYAESGNTYEGEWLDNRINGQGMLS